MSDDGAVDLRLRTVGRSVEDVGALQSVLQDAPDYARRVTGGPPSQDVATEVLDGLPSGFDRRRKHVWTVTADDEPIGCVDVLDGYPDPATAWIGLFLIRETDQGRGLGGRAWDLVEQRIGGWSHVRRIHLAVVGTNDLVRPFWESRGFTPTGDVADHRHGDVVSTATVMAKALRVPGPEG
ncbi:MAG: GNAT family N-acetyltransferase [Nocardioidaceae bacterium]|nr:GNAT family N-acetyltransferase [Nocardioidaceae bacterium]